MYAQCVDFEIYFAPTTVDDDDDNDASLFRICKNNISKIIFGCNTNYTTRVDSYYRSPALARFFTRKYNQKTLINKIIKQFFSLKTIKYQE